MIPVLADPRCVLLQADSAESVLPENSVDALVCDPPAAVSFMGKDWDSDGGDPIGWARGLADTLTPAWRAMKPGALGLVWALPRTSFLTGLGLFLTGFRVRDRIGHVFLNGMPKGEKRGEIGERRCTLLKPACEDWWLVQKPLAGTFDQNFERWGTGFLNLDACRIGEPSPGQTCKYLKRGEDCQGHSATRSQSGLTFHGAARRQKDLDHGKSSRDGEASAERRYTDTGATNFAMTPGPRGGAPEGKWPAHLILESDVDIGFDASRYFYTPKPSRAERDAGCDHLPAKSAGEATDRAEGSPGISPRAGAGRTGGARNHHPTVKSIALMRWLVRLITPPGGVVLDPFCGSGSTGVAALAEGCRFVGIEREADYIPIAEARLRHALRGETE